MVLLIVCFFTGLIHLAETMATSMRLAGVRTRQVASSLAFVNATLIISRMSNLFQAPLLGGMVDAAILHGTVDSLAVSFRYIIFAAFLGDLIGFMLLPSFVTIFTKAIEKFEEFHSLPRVIGYAFTYPGLKTIIAGFRLPQKSSLKNLSLQSVPKGFLILNVFMVAIYTVGVISSLFAGALIPAFRTTASQLSGIVNGIATVLLVLMVDPACALITDQAVRGKRKEADVKSVVFYIGLGRVAGALIFAQLLFLPAAEYIKGATLLVRGLFLH